MNEVSGHEHRDQAAAERPLLGPRELLAETWQAWNDRDLDRLSSLFAEDVVYDATEVGDAVIHGREKLRKYFDQVISISDVLFEIETLADFEQRVVTVLKVRGRGELSGAPILGHLGQVATVRNGLVSHVHMYADPADALTHIGLPPE